MSKVTTNDFEANDSRRRLPAGIFSFVLHFLIVLLVAWSIQSPKKAPSSPPSEKVVGIALVESSDTNIEYYTEESDNPDSAEQANSNDSGAVNDASVSGALPGFDQFNELAPGFLPENEDAGSIGAEFAEGLKGADGFLDGIAKGPKRGGDTGQATTSLFGIQGTGTRFVYVFDRSGSMAEFGGRPLRAAKSQLIASLDALGPQQQFQIIFYNERPRAFTPRGGRPKMIYATKDNKAKARKFILGIPGGGSTRHLPALKLGVDFAPDVLFFLTDAADPIISDANLDVIDRWNRNAATVHCIEFGTDSAPVGDNFLKKLARHNGGNYVYQNVTRFKE